MFYHNSRQQSERFTAKYLCTYVYACLFLAIFVNLARDMKPAPVIHVHVSLKVAKVVFHIFFTWYIYFHHLHHSTGILPGISLFVQSKSPLWGLCSMSIHVVSVHCLGPLCQNPLDNHLKLLITGHLKNGGESQQWLEVDNSLGAFCMHTCFANWFST